MAVGCATELCRQVAATDPALQHSTKDTAPAATTQLCRQVAVADPALQHSTKDTAPAATTQLCRQVAATDPALQHSTKDTASAVVKSNCFLSFDVCGFNMHRFFMQWFTVELFFDGELDAHAGVHLPRILPAMLVQSRVCIQHNSSGMDVTVTWQHGVRMPHLPFYAF